MDQRVYIKRCGRDQLGNTTPMLPNGQRSDIPYDFNAVEVVEFLPSGVMECRNPSLDKKTGEMVFDKTVDEVIREHADIIAGGRPYFIGSISDRPPFPEFRNSWFYDDSNEKNPKIGVNIEKAIEVQKQRIKERAWLKIKSLDPLDDQYDDIKKNIISSVKDFDLSGFSSTKELISAFPDILK